MADQAELLARTTEIVSAHLRRNTVPVDRVPALINDIHQTLAGLGVEEPDRTPAVPIKRSVRNLLEIRVVTQAPRCRSTRAQGVARDRGGHRRSNGSRVTVRRIAELVATAWMLEGLIHNGSYAA